MKRLLICFIVILFVSCNKHNSSNNLEPSKKEMDVVLQKMENGSLFNASGSGFPIGYYAEINKKRLNRPNLWLTTCMDSLNVVKVFRINVVTPSGPGKGAIIDTNSEGQIIKAVGYYDSFILSYYSQTNPEKTIANEEAINFYLSYQKAVIDYIVNY